MTAAASLKIVHAHRLRIAFTYSLTLLENLFELLYPWAVGLAIDGLLTDGGWLALVPFLIVWTLHIGAGIGRHLYDTRLFARILTELATETVLRQRQSGVGTAEVAARAIMGRELVDFFEREVPAIAAVAIGLVGGVAMLALYDAAAGLVVAGLILPLYLVNRMFGRRAQRLHRGLNDETERAVDVIAAAEPRRVRAHFRALGRWRIRLSNAEALTWTLGQVFAMAAVVLVLLRTTGLAGAQAGEIFAILAYVWRILEGLDEVPVIVQQVGRLVDIRHRIVHGSSPNDSTAQRSSA